MPAKDKLHEAVVRALEKDGWKIVRDPLTLRMDGRVLFVDLAAEKEGRAIVVEVKNDSFTDMDKFERALGQFVLYRHFITLQYPGYELFLGVPDEAFGKIFEGEKPHAQSLQAALELKFLVFNSHQEEIIQWQP